MSTSPYISPSTQIIIDEIRHRFDSLDRFTTAIFDLRDSCIRILNPPIPTTSEEADDVPKK